MLRSIIAALLTAALCTGASAQSISKDPTHAPNGTYRLDTMHSQVLFSIAHLGLTDYYGRFDKITGTLSFDGNDPEKSTTNIAIDTTSVDTPSNRLNDTLKGADVFSSVQFPTANFKTTSIARTGPDTGRITGDLTIKGVTKSVVLDAVFAGGGHDPLNGAYAVGFHATGTIRRSDFGMTGMVWAPFVGDDVHLVIEALFQQVKE
jgi:polyisoprenoid-binding protein YceI